MNYIKKTTLFFTEIAGLNDALTLAGGRWIQLPHQLSSIICRKLNTLEAYLVKRIILLDVFIPSWGMDWHISNNFQKSYLFHSVHIIFHLWLLSEKFWVLSLELVAEKDDDNFLTLYTNSQCYMFFIVTQFCTSTVFSGLPRLWT